MSDSLADQLPASIAGRTLRDLVGPPPRLESGSGLRESVERAATTTIRQLTLSDLRMLILQRYGLEFLVPRALDHVRLHPLAHATYYRGDLLKAVATLPLEWWRAHPTWVPVLTEALEAGLARLSREDAELSRDLGQALASARAVEVTG